MTGEFPGISSAIRDCLGCKGIALPALCVWNRICTSQGTEAKQNSLSWWQVQVLQQTQALKLSTFCRWGSAVCLKMSVVVGIMVQFQPSPVILNCCWSNTCNPKLRACLWITENSCQNWQLKYHHSISWAPAEGKCQGNVPAGPGQSSGGLWGSWIHPSQGAEPSTGNWDWLGADLASLTTLRSHAQTPDSQWNTAPKSLIRFSAEQGEEEKKRQFLCSAPKRAKSDPAELGCCPGWRPHSISQEYQTCLAVRSFSELRGNCCTSWMVTSADVWGYERAKIDSWSLGRAKWRMEEKRAFLKCNKEQMWSNYLKIASKPLKSMRGLISHSFQ